MLKVRFFAYIDLIGVYIKIQHFVHIGMGHHCFDIDLVRISILKHTLLQIDLNCLCTR